MIESLPTAGHHLNGVCANQQAHQVKKVATFLYKRPAAFGIKPVPVSHFVQKGKAVFTDAEHFDPSGCLGQAFTQGCYGRHIAIFHRNPDRCVILCAKPFNPCQVFWVCEQRLFDQNRAGGEFCNLFQLIKMHIIG